jgi:hypothetical protein
MCGVVSATIGSFDRAADITRRLTTRRVEPIDSLLVGAADVPVGAAYVFSVSN